MALNDTLSIDIARRGTIHIPAKQADHGYDIICTILRNGENIVDASTDTATFRVGKPDNTIYYGDATVNSDNTVTIHVDDDGQMLAVPGFVVVDVTLNDGNGVVKSTQNFVLDVQAAPGGEAIPSWSVFVELEELVADAREAIPAVPAAVEAANAAAENANAAAQHSVRFDTAQTLTTAQQEQARENIKAAAPDGSYGGMTVGYAEQLTSSIAQTDTAPYLYRTAGGNKEIGTYQDVKHVTGVSVAWNQMASASLFSGTGGSVVADGSALVYTLSTVANSTTGNRIQQPSMEFVDGHKYRIAFDIKPPHDNATNMYIYIGGSAYQRNFGRPAANVWTHYDMTVVPSGNATYFRIGFGCYESAGYVVGDTIEVRNIIITDLTLMLTPAIADYVYSLEQSSAGSGIAWLKSYGFFTNDYYPYNAGSMKHVTGLVSHDMVGFNAWDEEWELGTYSTTTGEKITSSNTIRCKNKIAVLPSTNYYFNVPYNIGSLGTYVFFYDADENFVSSARKFSRSLDTPQNARYMTFTCPASYGTTYNHDICINLHWDGERDGEYEAYRKESYALDSTVTLRGIPKLDASNNLYYDGDRYLPNGTVTGMYNITTVNALTWTRLAVDDFYVFATNTLSWKNYDYDFVCNGYVNANTDRSNLEDKQMGCFNSANGRTRICVRDDAYSSVEAWLAVHGIDVIVAKRGTPTTETAAPYTNPQWVDNWGTEEYVVTPDADGFVMPVGHETDYPVDLKGKLEAAPNNPQTDGVYLLQYSNGEATYTPLASNSTITDILARLTALEQQTAQEG